MGIRDLAIRTANKATNVIAKAASLSSDQVADIEKKRKQYLTEMPSGDNEIAQKLTERLLGACGVEIHNAYLPMIDGIYAPVDPHVEYGGDDFDSAHNIRHLDITKWVVDPKENSLEKLVNVYDALWDEECSIALIFHRTSKRTDVCLAVVNNDNDMSNRNVNIFSKRIRQALMGNFPGSSVSESSEARPACLSDIRGKSVAAISNVPAEKSEKFISQTIEKVLDGVVPANYTEDYTIMLLATPARDIEERKLRLSELFSALAPYAEWHTDFRLDQSDTTSSSATVSVNAGVSAGVQVGTNAGVTNSTSDTDSWSSGQTDSTSTTRTDSRSDSRSFTDSRGSSQGVSVGANAGAGPVNVSANYSNSGFKSKSATRSSTKATSLAQTVGSAITNTLGKAVTRGIATSQGVSTGINAGANFGVGFARSSTVSATIGKSEGITQTFTNHTVKHALDILEKQMERLDEASALGMWDFCAYVLSNNVSVATNVAHSYLALTQGEESFVSQAAVNRWNGNNPSSSRAAQTICSYLRDLRHPIFALAPALATKDEKFLVYPSVVNATCALSGKELAWALNFPNRSVSGLPVIECAEFGRGIETYDDVVSNTRCLSLGKIYHMHHEEATEVKLDLESLASHTFVTGSTGAGKTNAILTLLEETMEQGVHVLVVEPAKGEYKESFGGLEDVAVYGTNVSMTPLLRIDPFSFPEGIHVLEHLDRLVEVMNVCWPMYAAMPAVLKNAIESSYADCGWDLTHSTNPYGKHLFPNFADVARNVREILDTSEYDAENKGAYKGSLLTRLQSLTNGINGQVFTSDEIASEELFDANVVCDLSRVGSAETKSLIMGMLVLKLQEYRMAASRGTNLPLRHLTVLEEAHNLLRRTSTEQPVEGGNLQGKSVEMLANAIAEMRTYGEGFVIADQAPGLLDLSVIRNTNTKIILRLPDLSDRELVGRAAALNDDQITELSRLPRGIAAVYQNNWIQPVLCKVRRAEDGEPYVYEGDGGVCVPPEPHDVLMIAEVLSSCERVVSGARLDEVRAAMRRTRLPSSIVVSALSIMANPPTEPKMTRIGPVMCALFPDVAEAVVRSHKESPRDPSAWTHAASIKLSAYTRDAVAATLMADIIQGIVTNHIYNELHDEAALKDWHRRGGLR